ncbi:uncharacterized protein LOC129536125 [Moschus berezovskii]|uniref:uncharacterized protein LOC129536125 n=1 Tax=Moschus berezovskii TaxID=68408 RepID=UPI0024448CF7|nr:uncharacterized protein LOC129536125 [Moschus berezovskii]
MTERLRTRQTRKLGQESGRPVGGRLLLQRRETSAPVAKALDARRCPGAADHAKRDLLELEACSHRALTQHQSSQRALTKVASTLSPRFLVPQPDKRWHFRGSPPGNADFRGLGLRLYKCPAELQSSTLGLPTSASLLGSLPSTTSNMLRQALLLSTCFVLAMTYPTLLQEFIADLEPIIDIEYTDLESTSDLESTTVPTDLESTTGLESATGHTNLESIADLESTSGLELTTGPTDLELITGLQSTTGLESTISSTDLESTTGLESATGHTNLESITDLESSSGLELTTGPSDLELTTGLQSTTGLESTTSPSDLELTTDLQSTIGLESTTGLSDLTTHHGFTEDAETTTEVYLENTQTFEGVTAGYSEEPVTEA